jgi:hypothetical protein
MSTAEFERFRSAVLANRDLQLTLKTPADEPSFVILAVQTGKQHGFAFDETDVHAAFRAAERDWLERAVPR